MQYKPSIYRDYPILICWSQNFASSNLRLLTMNKKHKTLEIAADDSCFCIIGVYDENAELLFNKVVDIFGEPKVDNIKCFWNNCELVAYTPDEIYVLGIPIVNFGNDMTIKQMKAQFIDYIDSLLNIKLDASDVGVQFGSTYYEN